MANSSNEMLPAFVQQSRSFLTLVITILAFACFTPNAFAQQPSQKSPLVKAEAKEEFSLPPHITPQVDLRMPVDGHISSIYGTRRRRHSHGGLDIAAHRGTPIWAAAAGRVIYAGWRRGYGKIVQLLHPDGRETRYAHADSLLVSEGELVETGQQIATVGSTGRSTGAHLHFEVIEEDGSHVNPLHILNPELANNEGAQPDRNIRATYNRDEDEGNGQE
jgi:murein DD-endopeptidase MepM/ murein hydrolase activator NlpD